MKIVHVTNHFWPCIGGIETAVENLAKEQLKKHEVTIICLNKCAKGKTTLAKKEIYHGIEIHRFSFINLKYYLIAFGVLKEIKKYDVVHIHGLGFLSDFILATKFFHKKPIIVNTHGGIFHTNPNQWIKKLYFFGLESILLSNADWTIADSKNDLKLFSKIISPQKIKVIPNAIDLEKFRRKKTNKQSNTFLFVGRFSKNKRIDKLIELFKSLLKEIPNAQLWIVGRDFDGIQNNLKNQVRTLNLEKAITFFENIEKNELIQMYARADYFISASEYEAFGVSAIEAMAANCIPILSKIDSFEEFVETKKSGLSIDFKESEIASAIINYIQTINKEKTYIEIQKRIEKFSPTSVAEKVEKIYR